MEKEKNLDLTEFEEEHPAECAFIELMNALGAYNQNDKI